MQKNPNNINEAQFLQKMFKYFDIQNKGKVDFDQFYRAMEKTGIVMDRPVSIAKTNVLKLILIFCRTFLRYLNIMMQMVTVTWTTKNLPIFFRREEVPTKMLTYQLKTHTSKRRLAEKQPQPKPEVITLKPYWPFSKTN